MEEPGPTLDAAPDDPGEGDGGHLWRDVGIAAVVGGIGAATGISIEVAGREIEGGTLFLMALAIGTIVLTALRYAWRDERPYDQLDEMRAELEKSDQSTSK